MLTLDIFITDTRQKNVKILFIIPKGRKLKIKLKLLIISQNNFLSLFSDIWCFLIPFPGW